MNKTKNKLIIGFVLIIFIAASIFSAIFMNKVSINYNLADYLGKDTQTKIALDIIEEEFKSTGNIQVMAKNVSKEEAEEIQDKIEAIPNVLNVNFDKNDNTYYKNNNALFIVITDGDDYSDNSKQVYSDIKSALKPYGTMEYGGTTVEKQSLQNSITSEMVYILAISLLLVVAILLITSESFLEPFVLLFASGIAILINRGTNFFFGEISYITNSISAILQLALSMDYSIVLLHTFRRQKESSPDIYSAMAKAVKSVIKPVSASALTTIAGLLALLFMSFKIGFDIGIVLMKGIVISAITSVTLLPALILILDTPMKKLHKKAFVPKGKFFCKTALKAGKIITPVALSLVVVCGILQTKNSFIFSDTKTANKNITDEYGYSNTVVVVYKNSDKNTENEKKLADNLADYKTKSNKSVLSNYTAYSNTVREPYDAEKAVQKLEISEKDTQMLFTMYNLYKSPKSVKMTFSNFVDFADDLTKTDEDVKDFIDSDTVKTLNTLKETGKIASTELSADELRKSLSSGAFEGTDISLFSVKQIYGLYFYDKVSQKSVDFNTFLNYLISASQNPDTKSLFDEETVTKLKTLQAGIKQFEDQMETPLTQDSFKMWYYQNYGVLLPDIQISQIFGAYFASTGTQGDTIPFLSLMKFLAGSGQLQDQNAAAMISGYDSLYKSINQSYEFDKFIPALKNIAASLSGQTPDINISDDYIKQIYIMYFTDKNTLPYGKLSGKAFAEYTLSVVKTNKAVSDNLSDENRLKLSDIITADKYFSDSSMLTYDEAYSKLSTLQSEIKSNVKASSLDKDKVSGVYIKYACINSGGITDPMRACDLLDFVTENMDTNSLLKQKMSEENRKKVSDSSKDIEKAEDLFLAKNYSRMLLSINLPNESKETTEFVKYLSKEVKNIFGKDAYITGEIVSTYDLEKTFDHDNTFITIFTLISIFLIVMLIFKSLSLPVILVAVIQGAIFIAMSTQIFSSGIFFMSYIVSTCILMGATIDYGILMSSNYVDYRQQFDKTESLRRSVMAAMPTIFTSGFILIVCGYVIHFISSQNSISTVGLLIGTGTICSVIMITIVLPAVLYILDKFILKLSIKKK